MNCRTYVKISLRGYNGHDLGTSYDIFHSPEQTDRTLTANETIHCTSTALIHSFTAGKPQQLDAEQLNRPAVQYTRVSRTQPQRSVFSSDFTLLNRTYTLRRY
jgi:hypothetical protein